MMVLTLQKKTEFVSMEAECEKRYNTYFKGRVPVKKLLDLL